jgi:hypothetical protein
MNESEDYKRGFNNGFDQGERNGKTLADITIRQQQAEIERLSNDNYKFIKAMANKDSHIESLKQLLNDSVLRKAQEK